MMTADLFMWPVAALLAVGLLAVPAPRCAELNWTVYGVSLIACLALLALSLGHLVGDQPVAAARLPLGLPRLGIFVRVDALSAYFLAVASLGAASTSLYALGHGRHESAPGRVLPFYPWLLAAIALVLLADDAFTFLFAWALAAVVSWALIMARHRETGQSHAGYVYLIVASLGTLALLLAFGLLSAGAGSLEFSAMRSAAPFTGSATAVLLLALIGAGAKAGLVPLHVWQPLAMPAAPSHVSALMGAIMTKVAIYAFVRIVFEFLGAPAPWWGGLVLALAGATAILGVLHALMQHDLKRLLAYQGVQSTGVVFIGLGLALAFQANGLVASAALALAAALFHVLNHALVKTLLFLGAGGVSAATGERDMDRLGGLIRVMPLTAFTFLIGSAAISALPPLNAFASFWLTFQAILMSPALSEWGLRFLVPAVGALLALSTVLTAACFVRAFGITFQGRPRSGAAEQATDTDRSGLSAMLILVALCLVAGMVPGLVLDGLAPAVRIANGGIGPVPQVSRDWTSVVPVDTSGSGYSAVFLLCMVGAAAGGAALVAWRWGARGLGRVSAWDGGTPAVGPFGQSSASGFAQPFRRVFGSVVFAARERVDAPPPGDLAPAHFEVRLHDPVWQAIYRPLSRAVWTVADALSWAQFPTIRRHLSLVFAAIVALLLGIALWP